MPRKRLRGEVVGNKMEKTVAVRLERGKRHPLYKKIVRDDKRFLAHDAVGVKVGDLVVIEASRPYSRRKRFKVVEVLPR